MPGVHWNSHRDEELLDLVHGTRHTVVGLWDGRHHLNEHMQLHGQVSIFGFAALPELFFLTVREEQIMGALDHNVGPFLRSAWRAKLHPPCSCPSWNLYPKPKSWRRCPPAVS